MKDKFIIREQIEYYRQRAHEYDEWHMRLGRYYRGEEQKRQWFSELSAARTALKQAEPFGECLEFACGTGLWTPQLAAGAASLTAVDAVSETIEINRAGIDDPSIQYETADIFDWRPTKTYDFVFFGFWLSHVPPDRFNHFWEVVRMALKPGGRVFFVDSLKTPESTASDHAPLDNSGIVERKLNDGRTFNIVKIFYNPVRLIRQLQDLGWTGAIRNTGKFFYYGQIVPKEINQ